MSIGSKRLPLGLVISHLFDEPTDEAIELVCQADVLSFRRNTQSWLDSTNCGLHKARIFHWNLGTALDDFFSLFASQRLGPLLASHKYELFSFDLGPSAASHLGILPLSEPLKAEEILQRSGSAISEIRRYYQGPLGAELYNYYPTGLYEHVTEPSFIKKFLEEFDLKLVLDLAHAAITAHNKGMDPLDYFRALPLERVGEIHISRPFLPERKNLWAADIHKAPQEREFVWLETLLQENLLPPAAVFIECYESLSVLSQSQRKLAALLKIS